MVKKQHPVTASQAGLLHLMKSPANPTTKEGLEAYRELKKASGMETKEMLEYIGRKAHMPRSSDGEKKKQESRLEKLQPSE
jgi:hypothetical protein